MYINELYGPSLDVLGGLPHGRMMRCDVRSCSLSYDRMDAEFVQEVLPSPSKVLWFVVIVWCSLIWNLELDW